VSSRTFEYDGERLLPEKRRLKNLVAEDLAKFRFASPYAAGKFVLDTGCGAGQGTAYLAREGARRVVGVDISIEAVTYARDRYVEKGPGHNLAFMQMDAARLAFCDQTFEMVTSIELIEHLREPERYVGEIRRLLKDGGILILSTPNKRINSPTPGTMWPHHIHDFYPDELEELLAQYFSSVEMWGLSIPVYDQHPARRLAHWLAPFFKPILPHRARTQFLPTLQNMIKSDLEQDDIVISREQVGNKSTLVAVCHV
jgi:ubiquinone/menaquinone biosynthesis C-methylase UbiE